MLTVCLSQLEKDHSWRRWVKSKGKGSVRQLLDHHVEAMCYKTAHMTFTVTRQRITSRYLKVNHRWRAILQWQETSHGTVTKCGGDLAVNDAWSVCSIVRCLYWERNRHLTCTLGMLVLQDECSCIGMRPKLLRPKKLLARQSNERASNNETWLKLLTWTAIFEK